MPWKRTDPMEERMGFVMEAESDVFQISELCERYGVSRKTGYKWLQRYRREGVAGLQDRIGAEPPYIARIAHRKPSAKCSSRPGIDTRTGEGEVSGLAAAAAG